ncbi:hypothetical protein N657DRAFT_719352 [Parathielavia appendiculata]|uniref:Zn(2)-C6 fungal-type domain-containing protein n=1 Tax=Parathielavia appendiculata TaxID=2587402 RepID=A0AAN6Z2J0_9PEZI|nr:hypothetical protein N657DRAFT_719352 [Parathielavia appendiculata]
MVYGGKPSRGCRTCRARRIKCDEGKPTCKRCEKSKRECGGYRPEFEIVHRDQTGSTLRRLRKTASVHQQQSTDSLQLVFVREEPQPWRRQSLSPTPGSALAVPLAHRASCYFASNFILLSVGVAPHGFMEYLLPLMDTEPSGSALRHAFNACAFALLGNRAKADGVNLPQLSLKEHTLALAQTHKALDHSAMATADSTLAAVLLLCLYESITAIRESRMLAWRSHIDGAINIVKARGRDEMCKTRMGSLLFSAVRHHLAMSHLGGPILTTLQISRVLSSGLPLPFGVDWWMSAGDTSSVFATCQRFALEFSELRVEANHLLANGLRSSELCFQAKQLARRVEILGDGIASWLASIPADFRFQPICWVSEHDIDVSRRDGGYGEMDVFPGRVDIYPDFITAMAWNIGRVTRLLLASLNIRIAAWLCAPADYRMTVEYETSKRVCQDVIPDILASVPYHLGWRMNGKTLGTPGLSAFACGEEGSYKALPSLFLLWSLTVIKNHDLSTEDQRTWARGRLRFIAEEVGLKYAHIVNERLTTSRVNIRFPSMMIYQDGRAAPVDPLHRGVPAFAQAPAAVPLTPERLASTHVPPSAPISNP